ncbi:penicillin-insensitive murein endopeptidase [Echinimonas agarilytica]|uniref:Penicillin-insensitive murein endopeptidase n=1 Tax=Echinimonas agarilytica TaxID=1215918 RepID=A0AA42B6D5_9GAMM|nr:penicillin-insensitive murein endopeptidase [Echinimonas agarilytica]MCM2678670.1 penicillin-insensitive murein endopeptidase [Echinimonas agarilytica]
MASVRIVLFWLTLLTSMCATLAHAAGTPWESVRTPTSLSPNSIGSYSNGCVDGAQPLPLVGNGYQVIRAQRQRYFGHPELISYLQDLGLRAASLELPRILVADMAMPRGGRFNSGHKSHQSGLDADIWMRMSTSVLPPEEAEKPWSLPVVDVHQFKLLEDKWTQDQALMIQLAADDNRVERIFVHPTIKQKLCQSDWKKRDWLRKIRPWWGHYAHFHVRLKCPEGNADCKPQKPPPEGEGCGDELLSWWPDPNKKPAKATKPKPPPPMLPQCKAVLES